MQQLFASGLSDDSIAVLQPKVPTELRIFFGHVPSASNKKSKHSPGQCWRLVQSRPSRKPQAPSGLSEGDESDEQLVVVSIVNR